MNILMISHEYPPVGGGGANACMHLAKEYRKAGHSVTIVTIWYDGLKEYDNENGAKLLRLKSKRNHLEHCDFGEMADFLIKAFPAVRKLADNEKFDVCQIFFGIPSGPLGYFLKKRYGIPYVIRFGGGDIPGFQDRFSAVYKIIDPFIKLLWKNADALVANSQGLKQMAEAFYDKKEVLIIPNGAEIPACGEESDKHNEKTHERARGLLSQSLNESYCEGFAKGEQIQNKSFQENGYENHNQDNQEIELKAVRLLFVSRLIERKGLQDILPQLPQTIAECDKKNIRLFLDVVGDGPYRDTLSQIVKNEKLDGNVFFHGQKSKQELPEYYSEADIFIFPSRKEGMPNVVLEAMSYGLPIIMTPCQGSDELIDGNGIVTEADNFGKEIVKLALNAKTRAVMGKKSKELVRDRFSWENSAKQYLALFDKTL